MLPKNLEPAKSNDYMAIQDIMAGMLLTWQPKFIYSDIQHIHVHTIGSLRQSQNACPHEMILDYTAVIPKSIRSRLQRSVSPPPIPPRMQQLSTQACATDAPSRSPKSQ